MMNDEAQLRGSSDGTATSDEHTGDGTGGSGRARRGYRGSWLDYLVTILVALLIAVLVKTFLIQPFWIPSASMNPTLVEGDKILVSKLSPGVVDLDRGDVIVFQDTEGWLPENTAPEQGAKYTISKALSFIGLAPDPSQNHLVKRLVGLPGDHVVCAGQGADLQVNGATVDEPYVADDGAPCQTAFDVTVPDDSVWVLGDNRYDSADSAFHFGRGDQAFVPMDDVTGKAVVVFWPADHWTGLNDGDEAFADVPDPS
jgi:signal peptidase I